MGLEYAFKESQFDLSAFYMVLDTKLQSKLFLYSKFKYLIQFTDEENRLFFKVPT